MKCLRIDGALFFFKLRIKKIKDKEVMGRGKRTVGHITTKTIS